MFDFAKSLCTHHRVLQIQHPERRKHNSSKRGNLPTNLSNIHVHGINFRLEFQQSPQSTLQHQPILELQEYFIFISSCVGIWFGISMLDINPTKIMALVRGKKRKPIRIKPRNGNGLEVELRTATLEEEIMKIKKRLKYH